jgi:hypothetical protein
MPVFRRRPKEPKRSATMEFEVDGRPLRIYATHIGSLHTDAQGWPVINGQRLTDADIARGWVDLDAR